MGYINIIHQFQYNVHSSQTSLIEHLEGAAPVQNQTGRPKSDFFGNGTRICPARFWTSTTGIYTFLFNFFFDTIKHINKFDRLKTNNTKSNNPKGNKYEVLTFLSFKLFLTFKPIFTN